ncbi:hypothetical protein EBT31_14875, partial [bacterium]|nr:hypothetical protein [bacterium]
RTRSLTLGDIAQQIYVGTSGGEVRFKQGSSYIAQQLTLGYEYLTESETQQILDHYAGQQGSLIPFDLSAAVWGGYTTPPVSSLAYQWRYTGPFDVSIASPRRYSLTVELETVPL